MKNEEKRKISGTKKGCVWHHVFRRE